MTISPWLIYFANEADSVSDFLRGWGLIFLLMSGVSLVAIFSTASEKDDLSKKIFKFATKILFILIPGGFLFCLASSLIPSTKTCYEMFIIPKVVNSQLVQKLPDYLTAYIEKELKGATN